MRLAGQLALLADRHEAGGQLVRDGAAEDEAPRLQPHDLVDPHRRHRGQQLVDAHAKARADRRKAWSHRGTGSPHAGNRRWCGCSL